MQNHKFDFILIFFTVGYNSRKVYSNLKMHHFLYCFSYYIGSGLIID